MPAAQPGAADEQADAELRTGMRQLWQTGWMQQNVRMVVACFLTEYMSMHWYAACVRPVLVLTLVGWDSDPCLPVNSGCGGHFDMVLCAGYTAAGGSTTPWMTLIWPSTP